MAAAEAIRVVTLLNKLKYTVSSPDSRKFEI